MVADVTDTGGPSVLLVEDERSIAEPFAQALLRNGFRPLIASTGADALRLRTEADPDIVLLDLALPDMDGRDLCRQMRKDSDVPIIMVTARGTITDRVVGLELGADDYIVKPFSTGEAISRIRAVLRRSRRREGESAATGDSLTLGALRVEPAARRVFVGDRELELTRKELDLLLRLLRDAGRVVTRETLMSEVWDENWFGSTKTLDVHMASLRRKLGERSAGDGGESGTGGARYIHTVRGVGFRFASAEELAHPAARNGDAGRER